MIDLVLRGGLVADGSGGPLRRADVAVHGGRIVAVGEVADAAAREIDVSGLVVAPGVIDLHTHYDAQLWWDSAATPSILHGVTTVIGGNCGFSIAPLAPEQAPYLAAMLARVEGMPLASLQAGVPWDWRSFGDYLDGLEGTLAVNAGFLVGHTALRRVVLGDDDAREATTDELDALEALLHGSLEAGGLGFSSSTAGTHNDGAGRPVSSRYASREELIRLAAVTGEHPGTTLELIPSVANQFTEADMALMTDLSVAADRPLNWNILNVNTLLGDGWRQRLTASDHARARGGKVVALTMPISSTMRVNFASGFILDSFPGWTDLFEMPAAERMRELADPARRARMRAGVDEVDTTLTRRIRDWDGLLIGETFAVATERFRGRTLGDIVAEVGGDPFERLVDIVLADDLRTVIVMQPVGNDDASWRMRSEVWKDDRVVIGASDSGAHLDMIDTFVYATSLLGPIARDGRIELVEAVRLLTDVPARLYGLRDRGRVAVGGWADLVVFDADRVGPGPVHLRDDLPGGASRLYADAVGITHVFVNGVEAVAGGELTGSRSGEVLRSGRDTDTVLAGTAGQAGPAASPTRP